MADITLAEFDGIVWLVGGAQHLDDLLINALPADVTIELVTCERKSDVHALWFRLSGDPGYAVDPWMIHPNIAKRYLPAPPGLVVRYAPWSVMPDEAGQRVIAAAAAMPKGATLVLSASAAEAADLTQVRLRLLEDALAAAGVARARLTRDIAEAPGTGDAVIEIIVRP